jgi:hypothetical protein
VKGPDRQHDQRDPALDPAASLHPYWPAVWTALGWGERQLGFLLLIYFIVALGIRLDEISRTLGGSSGNLPAAAGDSDTVIAHLRDIKELLGRIDSKLQRPASDDDQGQRP